ncbi:MAG: L-2-hydroxyglutarate oxidase [Armatimonadetes bacterium]|nr:L-2-hydroxyglutarate oxidase [Armatimonadota bacterium]
MPFTVGIVGGGIVGLSVAYKLSLKFPDCCVIILEKESRLAEHQTGRNSGVIHSGIYYKPGSIKAMTCREGKRQLEAFCEEHEVKFERCGKVIVATDQTEIPALEKILDRGTQNGVQCRRIGVEELKELEPHVNGVDALHVPETGIVDYLGFCEALRCQLVQRGNIVSLNFEVSHIETRHGQILVGATDNEQPVDFLINCAGLYSDQIAILAGHRPKVQIVPFRGEYFELTPEAEPLCRNLIYPVPDPNFPFLGVHFTRMVLGGVECGPNAVLAFAREGYSNGEINVRELFESITYPGLLKLMAKHWRMGLGEMHRSFSKPAFVRALQKLVPEIREEHLHAAPAGVRAQAISRDGRPVDDFVFEEDAQAIHVINAVSPAATASLAIADEIVGLFEKRNLAIA